MEEEQFRQLVMPHHQRMMTLAIRLLRDRESALDCVQESLTTLWHNRHMLPDVSNIGGYCLICVRNRCLMTLREKTKFDSSSEYDSEIIHKTMPDDAPSALSRLELKERLAIIKDALASLCEKDRKVMLMIISGHSGDEIARATGLSPTNVRVITSRTRKYLKEYLSTRLNE